MDIKKTFADVCSGNKNKEIKEFFSIHKSKFDAASQIIKTALAYKKDPSPMVLVEGLINVVKESITEIRYIDDYFSPRYGWHQMSDDETFDLASLISGVVETFPSEKIAFKNDQSCTGKIAKTPLGDLGYYYYNTSPSEIKYCFRPDETTEEEIINFLIDQKVKLLNTNFISYRMRRVGKEDKPFLQAETISYIQSDRVEHYRAYIKRCEALGINRSLLFYGAPGTSKTTLAQSLTHALGYRTLKIRVDEFNFHTLKFIIERLNIDAIIIDDFDQTNDSNKMLEFLEYINANTKLVIAVVNSLKEFHPAVIRPSRFDELIRIETLEESAIRSMLGSLCDVYYERIKNFPAAYLKEFVIRSKLVAPEELEEVLEELAVRVNSQTTEIS
jgi:hypothetical protein